MASNRTKSAKKNPQRAGRYQGEIRFRAEPDLRPRLTDLAGRKRKDFSEYVREKLWAIVDAEETAARKSA